MQKFLFCFAIGVLCFCVPCGADCQELEFTVGVNTHWASDDILDRVPEMHMAFVRTGVDWPNIEPEFEAFPRYDWTMADRIVAANRERGIQILWGFNGVPYWASSNGAENGVPNSDLARERFRLYVRAVAERYRDDINYFEVWNEPNLERFWTGSVEEYVDYLLIPAYEEVKAVDPNKKILGPSLAILGSSARISIKNFFERLAQKNASRYVDILSQHVYERYPPDVIRQFERGEYSCAWFACLKRRDSLYKIYERAGFGGHPIWITEFGWRSDRVGEKRQANFLVETLGLFAARARFGAAFIYELQDDGRFKARFGVLRQDRTPKPAYDLLRQGFWQAQPIDDINDVNEFERIFNIQAEDYSNFVYLDEFGVPELDINPDND